MVKTEVGAKDCVLILIIIVVSILMGVAGAIISGVIGFFIGMFAGLGITILFFLSERRKQNGG